MPTITTDDGVTLNYLDEGSGRPVVLVAGFRAPATSWRYQTKALLDRGYRVLSLDRRSHGGSLHDHAVQDWRDTIAASRVPMLMIAAESSDYWPSAHASAMAVRNPLVTAQVVASGHAVNIEAPEEFNRALLAYLEQK